MVKYCQQAEITMAVQIIIQFPLTLYDFSLLEVGSYSHLSKFSLQKFDYMSITLYCMGIFIQTLTIIRSLGKYSCMLGIRCRERVWMDLVFTA